MLCLFYLVEHSEGTWGIWLVQSHKYLLVIALSLIPMSESVLAFPVARCVTAGWWRMLLIELDVNKKGGFAYCIDP